MGGLWISQPTCPRVRVDMRDHVCVEAVHIGCSGWDYPHWRGSVYPRGVPASGRLRHYATLFDTVEVNSTFYRLASRDAVVRWVHSTPPGFVFALKASRYLTHVKRLPRCRAGRRALLRRRSSR